MLIKAKKKIVAMTTAKLSTLVKRVARILENNNNEIDGLETLSQF